MNGHPYRFLLWFMADLYCAGINLGVGLTHLYYGLVNFVIAMVCVAVAWAGWYCVVYTDKLTPQRT